MEQERLARQLAFLVEIDAMKSVLRRNIIIREARQENDAEHSWHLAMSALVLAEYAPAGTDIMRAVRMALVHDLVEIYAGDTFCYDSAGNANKADRECAAADRLYAQLPADQGEELRGLWEEFDRMETPDAQFASALDRIQPLLLNVHTQGHTWRLSPSIRRADVLARMAPIANGLPALWDTVQEMVEDCVQKGWIRP